MAKIVIMTDDGEEIDSLQIFQVPTRLGLSATWLWLTDMLSKAFAKENAPRSDREHHHVEVSLQDS